MAGLWAAGAMSGAADAHSRVFIMDGNSGTLNFSCDVLGVMPVEGAFSRFVAVISIDDDAPQDARAVVRVDADSLTTDETDWIADLKGPDFFDVTAYPEFSFASHSAAVVGPGELRIEGALTLRGQTRPVTLNVRYQAPDAPDGAAAVTAVGEVNRNAFGMDAYDLVLSDNVTIEVSGMARPGYPPPVAAIANGP